MRRLPLSTAKLSPNAAGTSKVSPPASSQDQQYLHWKRRIAHLARWLHTYLSMLSFAILLFFAVTGLTLNHAEWFEGQRNVARYQGALDAAWMKTPDPNVVAQDKIVAYLRRVHGIKSEVSDFRVDDEQCEVLFKGPGYEADASIDRQTGKYDLTVSRFGLVAVLDDLHKGRDTGGKWSAVIDFSAILMTLVSLTGLTLIFFLNKRRLFGLLIALTGALLCYIAYALWVSRTKIVAANKSGWPCKPRHDARGTRKKILQACSVGKPEQLGEMQRRARALLPADHRKMILMAVEISHEHNAGFVVPRRCLEDMARQRHRRSEHIVESGLVAGGKPRQRVGRRGRDGIEDAEQRMGKALAVAGDQFGIIEIVAGIHFD